MSPVCGSSCVPVVALQGIEQEVCCPLSIHVVKVTGVSKGRAEFMFSGPCFIVDGKNACLGEMGCKLSPVPTTPVKMHFGAAVLNLVFSF